MVQQTLVSWTILGFGAHTLLRTTGGVVTLVLQQLITVYALELMLGELLLTLKLLTQCTSQWVALNLPEFRDFDARRVQLQGCTH